AVQTPDEAPAGVVAKTPGSASLGPLEFISQTVNNCGPASIAEVLHFWGINRSQDEVQSAVRGSDPYGMTPATVPAYAQSLGMEVFIAGNGGTDLLKALIANGFPVIANQTVSLNDPTFHFRPIA